MTQGKETYFENYEIAAERHFAYSVDNGRDDCGGTGPDVDCAGVCFGDSYVDECGACNADASDDFVCLDITGLSATGGLNEVFLQWDNNESVSSYNIYRDGELIASF